MDHIRLEEYEMHVYDREEKAFIKWREGRKGRGRRAGEKIPGRDKDKLLSLV